MKCTTIRHTLRAMANRIREIRKAKGLSAEALAEALGCTKDTVYNLEKEARGLTHDWMRRLAKALECKPSDFLPDDEFNPRLDVLELSVLRQFRQLSEKNRERFLDITNPISSALTDAEQNGSSPPEPHAGHAA